LIFRTGDEYSGELTAAQKRRGLRVLLATTFLTWGGFFAVIPLIAVHYVDGLGWAAGSVGLVLAVRQFLQQSSTMFCGAIADRFGAKWLICGGLGVRVVGFGMMAWADTLLVLMISAIITAIGGGLFEAPASAAIATFTDESNRRHYYSSVGVIGGLGTAIGVLSGALLIRTDFGLVSLGTAAVFFIAFVLTVIYLPPVQVATERIGVLKGLSFALSDRIFVSYAALLIGFYFVNTQFNLALVLRATDVAGTESAVAWIYLINAGLITLLGYPLPRFFERRTSTYDMLILGTLLIVVGMAAIAIAVNVPLLLACVVIMSFGMILSRPGEKIVSANLADPAARGSYLGVASLSLAIGGGLGNLTGGLIYDLGERIDHPELPWIIFGLIGLATVTGLWQIRGSVQRAHNTMQARATSASAAKVAAAPRSPRPAS
jgi:DHA1 family multidrug resistance protein-like MFS transporter